MSIKELDRGKVLEQVRSKRITKVEAAKRLGITRQHVDRLYQKFCKEGDEGLISKRRGQPSNNRIPDPVREAVIKVIRERYSDFKPGFAHEKLTEEHEFKLSDETVRQIMIDAGIWKGKTRKHAKVHQMRTRRPARGELIQLDGSPHDWFEGRRGSCCLLVLIDDATSEIMGLRFVENECLQGYFDLIREYIERCGRPLAFYADKHAIFHINTKEAASGTGETQLGRAARTLDIELIPAHSAPAKGRVERANLTFQDRLIKEMRLAGLNDMEAANSWLPGYIKKHNRRFAVEASSPIDAHRQAIPKPAELDHIFSVQAQRKLSKNLEISYNNVIYQILTKAPGYSMRGAYVTVCESPSQVVLLYKNKPQPYKTFDKNNRPKQAVSGKDINAHFDKRTIGRKPKSDHPWYSGLAS
ncbi:MAG: ISNCY family transposase [Gammaproteobacteria bacterium]|nr:ISNCY family transposase [Gammaproteobacteria bacterium]